MPRPPSQERDVAIAELRRLTTEHGVKTGIRLARKAYPNVPNATWARWRQFAVGNITHTDVEAVASLALDVRQAIPMPEHLAPALSDPVPVTHRALTFWKMLDELEFDAQLMRDFAVTKGADGKTKLRAPFALRDAHRMRCDLIRLALQQAEVAWTTERAATFYKTIIDAIGDESPDCQRRIMERLKQVQSEAAARGF